MKRSKQVYKENKTYTDITLGVGIRFGTNIYSITLIVMLKFITVMLLQNEQVNFKFDFH